MTLIVGTIYKEVYEYIDAQFLEQLKANDIKLVWIDYEKKLPAKGVQVLISGTMKAEQIQLYPDMTDIMVPYTGLDGLELDALKNRGIRVYNTSAHGIFVAERALALLLSVMGKVVYFDQCLRNNDWCGRGNSEDRIQWDTLFGKKIGIYGYGTIGKAFHELIKPFNGEVGIVKYKNRKYQEVSYFDDLNMLAQWCDIMVCAAPLNQNTLDSIGDIVFKALKEKVLINVGRGDIVNEKALYEALKSNELAGFGSDVWYCYPKKSQWEAQPGHYDFAGFSNVVMTPHNAGFEKSSRHVRYKDLVEQIVMIKKNNYVSALDI